MSALCARPRAITSPTLQIPNYLTFGPTQVEEMDPVEFGGHLPITTVMWYFDTHLFYLKQDKSFKPAFVFIDHQPDLVCKIASIEPDSRMYLLGVTSDNLSDWVNRVQTQLNHVLTQGSKLDASGDWDQQANWSNRGIPLWVRDDKVGSDALSLKDEETVEKGQAAEALAPAKRKSTGGEPARKKKKTASKPQAAKSVTGAESDESDGDEEAESEEEEEEEAQVSQGKAAKKVAAKLRSEETGARAPFKQPARQSQPRSEPAEPPPKGKTSVAKALGSKMQTVPKKK